MPYGETKVYFDGSHYIAIPHTENPREKRYRPPEEEITVTEPEPKQNIGAAERSVAPSSAAQKDDGQENEKPKPAVKTTKKQLFERLYEEHLDLPRGKRKEAISNAMRPHFGDGETAELYVAMNIERKRRNLTARRVRLTRKANLQKFNYFVTFTYNDALHTEASFRRGLRNTLSHLCARKGWKYIGVWERSPKKDRLHFHGVFRIPEGTLPGPMTEVCGYSFSERKRRITHQSDYFKARFGRNDFSPIENREHIGDALAYLLKYIEKSGEKVVYSRGLPQFFLSDILDEDVVCRVGSEEQKLLLYDDFTCFDAGRCMGKVSPQTIRQMRKSN